MKGPFWYLARYLVQISSKETFCNGLIHLTFKDGLTDPLKFQMNWALLRKRFYSLDSRSPERSFSVCQVPSRVLTPQCPMS